VLDDPASVVIGADAVIIATEWREFRELPWATWARRPGLPLIIDGRRLLDAAALREAGYTVVQLGDGRTPAGSPAPVLQGSTRKP
jgi:UDPglucose 6-dehydrogenase